jgi:hypothetical protein
MESLKQELLQSQKTRDDLMKWKLLLVSAIGSVALGFSGQPKLAHPELALCVIPFVCCYVDLLCRNLSIRTKLLSGFLSAELASSPQDSTARFEEFYQLFDAKRERKDGALEGLALVRSTWLLCFAVFFVGITNFFGSIWHWDNCMLKFWSSLFFWASGIGGWVSSYLVERKYKHQKKLIKETVKDWKWEVKKKN